VDIAALHQLGRAAWPTIDVPLDAYAAYMAEREVGEERAVDLYLACACVQGNAGAVAEFERVYLEDARVAVARVTPDRAIADEALQLLRQKLFVAAGGSRGIAGYAGRGDLRAWVRVAAARVAISLLRGRRMPAEEGELAALVAGDPSPEVALIKKRYATEANTALRAALAELTVRERNLLRQHFVDGLGIDALGAVYGVHRTTCARWLRSAQAQLEKRTRALLIKQLGIGRDTADDIIAMLRSDLHITLSE
jgi:RNA polymerase sigma-70 factor, ECF subfamily